MRKKAMRLIIVAAAIGIAVVLYITLQLNTCSVEDILAVYKQNADYSDIAIEYPLDETLFPPEIVPPVFRWKDSVPASEAWLVRIEFADGNQFMHFPVRRQQWIPDEEDWDSIKRR